MATASENLDKVRLYLRTLETGSYAAIADLFSDDMVIEQLPNRIYAQGVRHNVRQMAEGFEKGRKLFLSQTYEIKNALAAENSVAAEVLWTGTLAVAFGSLQVGSQMRAHSGMFFQFKEGKIASQRNYDCFEPW